MSDPVTPDGDDPEGLGKGEDTLPQGSLYEAPIPNAADKNQIDVAVVQTKRRDDQDKIDLAVVLSTPEGRRFVYRLIAMTDMLSISGMDSNELQRAEGRRWVGAQLLDMIKNHSLSPYPQLLLERAAQLEIDERARLAALSKRTSDQENVD